MPAGDMVIVFQICTSGDNWWPNTFLYKILILNQKRLNTAFEL